LLFSASVFGVLGSLNPISGSSISGGLPPPARLPPASKFALSARSSELKLLAIPFPTPTSGEPPKPRREAAIAFPAASSSVFP